VDIYVAVLEQLGFSGLESEVYIRLLESGPMTGYQISQTLGKPRANVYQVLESLFHKGIAVMDESGTRLFRAVDPSEVFGRLEKEYSRKARNGVKVLGKIKPPPDDQGVYQMKSQEQTIERARVQIAKAKRIILLDISPSVLTTLTDELKSALSRGVIVGALLYGEQRIEGAIMNPHHRRQELRKRWKGCWLNLVCDGKHTIWSLFRETDGQPVQALYSSSPFISWIYHSALAAEIMMSAVANACMADTALKEITELIQVHQKLTPRDAPGALELEALANE
jgi:sugar-specific transcriptional regulator TrmB